MLAKVRRRSVRILNGVIAKQLFCLEDCLKFEMMFFSESRDSRLRTFCNLRRLEKNLYKTSFKRKL